MTPETFGPKYENSPIYEGWTIDAGYTGMFHADDRTGRVTARHTNGRIVPLGEQPVWRVEVVRSEADARTIWAHRSEIEILIRKHARPERGGSDLQVRLAVTVEADHLTVSEYDYGRWTDTVEVAR